jgi:DNA-binding beta-propeller fold protein YncE
MKALSKMMGALFICIMALPGCEAQSAFGTELLQKIIEIPMPGVKGRIDHLDCNLREQLLYVAALGNNTVEVVDLKNKKILHSIKGLSEPQGIGYIPQHEEIFIANGGNGECYFFNGRSYEKTATIKLSSDADDVRYDSAERKIYVGYGDGGIAIIDADSHKQVGDIKLPAHPESFQIDKKLNLLFVNLPDAQMIGVIDLLQLKLTHKWERNDISANFPMALDKENHQLFVGYRHPAKLLVLDGTTGKENGLLSMTGDADDLYYDQASKEVFVSGGDGHINIFRKQGGNSFKQVANIPTRNGARTSLLIPELKLFVLAARADAGQPAGILVFQTAK